jgi:thioredoxin 1
MGILSNLFGERVKPTSVRTRAEFQREVRDSQLPVIVDVWSENCAPCRQLAHELLRVAHRHRDRVRVVEISTDAELEMLRPLQVTATPTILLYVKGEEVGRAMGFRPEGWFDEMIAKELAVAPSEG